jgi:hypothetical protein
MTDATTMLIPQVIGVFGVVACAEALYIDDPEARAAMPSLFETSRYTGKPSEDV